MRRPSPAWALFRTGADWCCGEDLKKRSPQITLINTENTTASFYSIQKILAYFASIYYSVKTLNIIYFIKKEPELNEKTN